MLHSVTQVTTGEQLAYHRAMCNAPPMSNQQASTDVELIGSGQAARILDVHPSTVARWVHAGRLNPVTKLAGEAGGFLFRRSDVEQIADELAAAETASPDSSSA